MSASAPHSSSTPEHDGAIPAFVARCRTLPWERRLGLVLTTVVAIGIAAATLTPMPARSGRIDPWCLVCGDLGGIDVLLNVLLFVPLGTGLALSGVRLSRAAAIVICTTLTIETLQYLVIPGRDATVSDVLTNSLGGLIGATLAGSWRRWLLATPAVARALLVATTLAWFAALAVTAWLLAPSVPYWDYYGQPTPRQPQFAPFEGRLYALTLNGLPIPQSLLPDRDRYLSALWSGQTRVEATISPGPPTPRTSAIGRMANWNYEAFMLGQRGRDLVFRIRLRGSNAYLRSPALALPNAFPGAVPAGGATDTLRIAGGVAHRALFVELARGDTLRRRELPFSVALGWSLLVPFDWPLDGMVRYWSALWLAALLAPVGFWAALATPDRHRRDSHAMHPVRVVPLVVPFLALALGLTLIPAAFHFAPAHPSEWLGGAAGALLGLAVGELAARARDRRWLPEGSTPLDLMRPVTHRSFQP